MKQVECLQECLSPNKAHLLAANHVQCCPSTTKVMLLLTTRNKSKQLNHQPTYCISSASQCMGLGLNKQSESFNPEVTTPQELVIGKFKISTFAFTLQLELKWGKVLIQVLSKILVTLNMLLQFLSTVWSLGFYKNSDGIHTGNV